MKEIIFIVETAPEGGWVARALGYSIFTEAEELDELRAMIRDAGKPCYVDGEYRIK